MRASPLLRRQLTDAGFIVDHLGGDFVVVSGPASWVDVLVVLHPIADLTVAEILEGALGDDYRVEVVERMLAKLGDPG